MKLVTENEIELLLSTLNAKKKFSDYEVEKIDHDTTSCFNNILQNNLKFSYLLSAEYFNLLRDLDPELIKTFNVRTAEDLKKKFSEALRRYSDSGVPEESQEIERIMDEVLKLKTQADLAKQRINKWQSEAGSILDNLELQERIYIDNKIKSSKNLIEIQNEIKPKLIAIASLIYIISFFASKVVEAYTENNWVFSFLSFILFFIIGYFFLEKLQSKWFLKARVESLKIQVQFLQTKVLECERRINASCTSLAIDRNEIESEFGFLIGKLDSVKRLLSFNKA